MKKIIQYCGIPLFLLFLFVLQPLNLQGQTLPQVYVEVAVNLPDEESAELLEATGVDLDHFHPEIGINKLIIPESELGLLVQGGFVFSVIEDDVAAAIEERNAKDLAEYVPGSQEKTTNGFELGSMGGFYTFAEIVAQLDEMSSLYPNIITPKFSIGTTIEGRTIWAVKISDNPSVDESATEAAVYFDALHHAR